MYVASQYASIYPIKIDDTFLIPLRRPNSRRPLIIQTLPSQGQSVSIFTYLPVQVPSGRPRQSVEPKIPKTTELQENDYPSYSVHHYFRCDCVSQGAIQ